MPSASRDSTSDSVDTSVATVESNAAAGTSGGHLLVAMATRVLKRCQMVMKDSPLTVIGLSAKDTPKISEIVEQTRILCEDYIFGRMLRSGDLDKADESTELNDGSKLTDVSLEIQLIGCRLESTYPRLYSNVSQHISMPIKSEADVRRVITSLGDFLFKHGVVTWCRIVALFAISGAVANESAVAGHPEHASVTVSTVTEVISRHAAAWISHQGGWVEIMKAFRLNKETRNLWILAVLGVLAGFFFTWITAIQI